MKSSIKKELSQYIIDKIKDGIINDDNTDDWHDILFNEDYYIIYNSQAKDWVNKHNICPFEIIADCIDFELFYFGERCNKYENAQVTVNMYIYALGYELLDEVNADNVEELKESLENYI